MVDVPSVRYSWTQPICEHCWILQRGQWSDTGNGLQELKSLQMPARFKEASLERCAYCGQPTFVGIFVRDNPANVTFPHPEVN